MRRSLLIISAPAYCLACCVALGASLHWTAFARTRVDAQSVSASTQTQGEKAGTKDLSCAPDRLYRGESLTLMMPETHGGYLALVNPRGDYFFLTLDQPEQAQSEREAGVNPVIKTDEFTRLRQLQLSTTETKALDYNRQSGARGRRAQAVFRQTGWYKVLISDTNFEREDPAYNGLCRVYYVNRSRRSR